MPGRHCSICTHPERTQIESALLGGTMSFRSISARYGMSKTSVARHVAEHMGAMIENAKQQREIFTADAAVAELMRIKGELAALTDLLRQQKKYKDAGVMLEAQARQVDRIISAALQVEQLRQQRGEAAPMVIRYEVVR